MRAIAFVLCAVVALAATAVLSDQPETTDAETAYTAITACAVQGGSCPRPPLDSSPDFAPSHSILEGACAGSDLHVVRYLSGVTGEKGPLVATFCD